MKSPENELLYTKLHPPPLPDVLIERENLFGFFDRQVSVSFTLVSAPAGYGKSTFVRHWLEHHNLKSSWISLDEFDNDLHRFFRYILAAINQLFPGSCSRSESLIKFNHLPSVDILLRHLANDLFSIKKKFVLVLDDYQFIKDTSINAFIEQILRQPIPSLHLILISRRDPALPLSTLRSKINMVEIRVQDLRFSRSESRLLVEKKANLSLLEEDLNELVKRTEGWIAGLHLTALTLRNQPNISEILKCLPEDNRYVVDYIVAEVISKQPQQFQEALLAISILERFNKSLCEAVCNEICFVADAQEDIELITWIEEGDLFLIPLDGSRTWFRFHHLFRSLLNHQLVNKFSKEQINNFYVRAGKWFADHKYIEESIHYLLKGNDIERAIDTIAENRHSMMNQEKWHLLERCLENIPSQVIDKNLELVIAKAWTLDRGVRIAEVCQYVEKAGVLIAEYEKKYDSLPKTLNAEYKSLKSFVLYLNGEGEEAACHAQQALADLPAEALSVRGFSTILLAGSYQMIGKLDKAYKLIDSAFKNECPKGSTYHSRLFVSLCFINWIAADMSGLIRAGRELLKLGNNSNLPESISLGNYFLGTGYYNLNQLGTARKHFKEVFDTQSYTNVWDYVHCGLGLALINSAEGKHTEANSILEQIVSFSFQKNNTDITKIADALMTEIKLRQGDYKSCLHWIKNYNSKPFSPGYRSYISQLTYAKALLAQKDHKSLEEGRSLLQELYEYYKDNNNVKYLIDVCLLQSLYLEKSGFIDDALIKLEEAVETAEPSGLIQPFLDLGQDVYKILIKCKNANITSPYVKTLLKAFVDYNPSIHNDVSQLKQSGKNTDIYKNPQTSLTNRECQLLKLVSDGLSNDEIAEELFISTETVKTHLSNIYKKLEVKNRRLAVIKAHSVGIL